MDGTIQERMSDRLFAGMDLRLENPAGLAEVWAEEHAAQQEGRGLWSVDPPEPSVAIGGPIVSALAASLSLATLKSSSWLTATQGRMPWRRLTTGGAT